MMNLILNNPLLILFSIIFLGTFLGTRSIRGISLGPGAIFLTALFFGNFGFSMPGEIMSLGVVLFVYAIGIQVGPKFFTLFRKEGWKLTATAFVMSIVGVVATVLMAILFHIPANLASGMFAGSLMNTPSLAAAVDVVSKLGLGDTTRVTAGYGIAYPFAVLFTILFVQFLPAILRRNPKKEEEEWVAKERLSNPPLSVKQFFVENPACFGKSIGEIHPHHIAPVNFSRVRRHGKEFTALSDFCLEKGDIVTAVGKEEDLQKLNLMLGHETSVGFLDKNVISTDIELTSPELAGKSIGALDIWHKYNIVMVRVIRQDFEVAPYGSVVLEYGDTLRVVGDKKAVDDFVKLAGVKSEKINETNLLPFVLGLVFGLLLGSIPIPLPHGAWMTLGPAGGALLAGIIISQRKRIGNIEMHVPSAALNIIRELGLMLFLAGAGLVAGSKFVSVFQEYGFSILFAGALITLVTLISGTIFLWVIGMDILSIMAGVSAGMTQSSALMVTKKRATTELPTLAYVAIYPFAMILKIVLVQILISLLMFIG